MTESTRAILALEDGAVFEGRAFGRAGETTGEVVFNTALSGYQEVLTDPSYAGQIVTMTYPHIGNYGINGEDLESARPQVAGFVVREVSSIASSWRASGELPAWLAEQGVVGISDIDTRMLTKHLRTHGAKRGIISTVSTDREALVARARASRSMVGLDLAREVTCPQALRGRIRKRGREAVQGGRLRLRDQAEHPPDARRRGVRRDGGAGGHDGGGGAGSRVRKASSSPTGRAIPSL